MSRVQRSKPRFARHPLTIPQKGHQKRMQKSAETKRARANKLQADCRRALIDTLVRAGFPEELVTEAVQEATAALPIGYWVFNKGKPELEG